jgi:hypothetical protein
MLTIEPTKQAAEAPDGTPAGTALVPTTPASPQAPVRISRPDPGFVTHLIATAEQVPQTRLLRRAAPFEALSAYAARFAPPHSSDRQTRPIVI